MTAWLLAKGNPLNHVVQHTAVDLNEGAGFFSLPLISNHIIMQVVAALLLVWLLPRAVQMRAGGDEIGRLVPRGLGSAVEAICQALRTHIFEPNLGKYTERFTPYLWSLFYFILACNVLGLLPLADWFFFVPNHQIGGTSTGNFYVTGTLAAITFIMVVYNGLKFHGLGYVKHFFMGPWWISWFIAILEIVGLVFKCGALCIRLTANMLAGHILLAVLIGFVASAYAALNALGGTIVTVMIIAASVAIYFLEILVAFLHAFIFTTLTTVFVGLAVNIHHDEEHAQPTESAGQAQGAVAAAH